MDIKQTKKLFEESIESESVTKQVRDRIKKTTWQNKTCGRGLQKPLIR